MIAAPIMAGLSFWFLWLWFRDRRLRGLRLWRHKLPAAPNRERSYEEDVPLAIDMLVLCFEGGLGVTSALRLLAEVAPDLLGGRVRMAVGELSAGKGEGEVLASLGLSEEAESLWGISTIVDAARKWGVPVHEIMESLSENALKMRRIRLEQEANKIPFRLTVCSVLTMLPPLLMLAIIPYVISFLSW